MLDDNSTDYKEVNIAKGELTEEYDMAVIVAPKTDYTPEEIDTLNAYLKSGKDLEVFLDFSSEKLTKLETYLEEWGICYTRNTPDMSVREIVAESNAGHYFAHLAIHSNASPENLSGLLFGSEVFYYPTSADGKRFAEIPS